jgi:hypothetical protein
MEFLSSFFFIVVKSKFCFHFLLWLHCYCCATCFSSSRISHPASGTGPLLPAVFSQPIFIARVSSPAQGQQSTLPNPVVHSPRFLSGKEECWPRFFSLFRCRSGKALVFF